MSATVHHGKGVSRRRFLGTAAATAALVGADLAWAQPQKAAAEPAAPTAVVLAWNDAALTAIRVTHPGPPMVARMLAVVHTAMYDAWAAYTDVAVGTRLGSTLRQPPVLRTDENKATAVSYAAYRALVDLFPSEVNAFNAVMLSLGYPVDNQRLDASPAGIGNIAAQAVIDYRHQDGSNQLGDKAPGAYSDYTGYQPVNTPDEVKDPNRWQPLRVPDGHGGSTVQEFIAPHWGLVLPFAISGPDQFTPPAPAQFGTQQFKKQVDQVIDYSARLTDEQKVIAEYWADGPTSELPPGHWNLFAQFVSKRDQHTLDDDIRLFFTLNNAILDASIASWGAKRKYDYVRPVTAVRHVYGRQKIRAWAGPGEGTQHIPGSEWQPYQAATVVTPPFAEYYSGHSIFSAAAAEVLMRFTGSDAFGYSYTQPANTSRVEPNVPASDVVLTWATFSAAADEAGISRLYGGIHFIDGDIGGRKIGRKVADVAWSRAQRYITGAG